MNRRWVILINLLSLLVSLSLAAGPKKVVPDQGYPVILEKTTEFGVEGFTINRKAEQWVLIKTRNAQSLREKVIDKVEGQKIEGKLKALESLLRSSISEKCANAIRLRRGPKNLDKIGCLPGTQDLSKAYSELIFELNLKLAE